MRLRTEKLGVVGVVMQNMELFVVYSKGSHIYICLQYETQLDWNDLLFVLLL